MFDFLKNVFGKKSADNVELDGSSGEQSAKEVYAEVEKQATSNYSAAREAEAQVPLQAQETEETHSSVDDPYAELRAQAKKKKDSREFAEAWEADEELERRSELARLTNFLYSEGINLEDVKGCNLYQEYMGATKRRMLEERTRRHKAQVNDVASFESGAVWADRIAELIKNKEVEGAITPDVARDLIKYINTGQYERDKQAKEDREAAARAETIAKEQEKRQQKYKNDQLKSTIRRRLKDRQKEQEKDSSTIVSGTVRADILADAVRAGEVEGPVTPDKAKAAIKKRIADNGFDHS